MTLEKLNSLSKPQAHDWLSQTCAAEHWISLMVDARPYKNIEDLLKQARNNWQQMGTDDLLEAFTAHPMIGDVNSLRVKFSATKATASHEQSGAAAADEDTLQELSKLNFQYLGQNGFIFIICATGLSADTMLAALKARISNDTATELSIAGEEQIKITLLRLQKALSTQSEKQ
jgi:2-oxo-4-hydroxy-4-carboxy-5-ureidoimidazoline decarboxylase